MFTTPTIAQLRETATELGMSPSDDYLEATQRIVAPLQQVGERFGANVKVVEVPPGPPVIAPLVAEVCVM